MSGANGAHEAPPMARMRTGSPELDLILGGGFPAHSLNVVMGHPGTGKTIFAEQLLFHNADGERPSLFLTTLSEPLPKVVTYLQHFQFFDPEALGSAVVYDDIGVELAREGPDVVVDRVSTAIREMSPRIIVIDSFKAIHDLEDSPQSMRRMIAELAGILSAYDTTAFLVGEYTSDDVHRAPEFAVADGIIEFSRVGATSRDERFLRVLKLRGSAYQEGFHAFRITGRGIEVFPRLVTPSVPTVYRVKDERLASGVAGLDSMLDGGLRRGSATLVVGTAGTGKTTLGVTFAAQGAMRGEPSLYLHLQENPTQLAQTIGALGLDLEDLRSKGLDLRYISPVELQIDSLIVELFRTVRENGIRRLVVDPLEELAIASADPSRFHAYSYALLQHLAAAGVTTLFTMEFPGATIIPTSENARLYSLVDAIVELGVQLGDKPYRFLRVVKGRGISHDLRAREMVIQAGGIQILNGARA